MFMIAALHVCFAGYPYCTRFIDNRPPYATREICEARIELVLSEFADPMGQNFAYFGACGILGPDGQLREVRQYLRPEGDPV